MVLKPIRGIVVSNKMMKTVNVMVERISKHPRFHKYIRKRKKCMVRFCAASPSLPLPQAEPPPQANVVLFFSPHHRNPKNHRLFPRVKKRSARRWSPHRQRRFERQHD